MKKSVFAIALLVVAASAFAADYTVTIQLKNVNKGGGKVFMSIYDSEKNYKESKPLKWAAYDATDTEISVSETLGAGEYVMSAYQDANGNNKLDANILGIPKEPVGISNYTGKGIPGGFKELKTAVSGETTIVVELKKI